MNFRSSCEYSWESDSLYDSRNCNHDDYKYHVIDEREGTIICTRCSCVIEENCVQSQGAILQTSTQPEFQKSITQKIDQLGIKYSYEEQKTVLEDWMENNHIPRGILDLIIRNFKKLISQSHRELTTLRPTLEELTAVALHITLLDELTPKSLGVISIISNVPVKRLNRIDSCVNNWMNTLMLKPSIWMPGLTPYVSLDFKAQQHVCQIADKIQEYYAFSPITILTCALSWHFSQQNIADKKQTMSNQALCMVTGIALSTLKRAMKIFVNEKTFEKYEKCHSSYINSSI